MSKQIKRPLSRKKTEEGVPAGETKPAPIKKKVQSHRKPDEKPPGGTRRVRGRGPDVSTAVLDALPAPAAPSFTRPPEMPARRLPPTPAPAPTPSFRAPDSASASSSVSSFGAGIFDAESDLEPSPKSAPSRVVESKQEQPPTWEARQEMGSQTPPQVHSDHSNREAAKPPGARRPVDAPRKITGRKSRKQRLEEEAEVLAALTRPGARQEWDSEPRSSTEPSTELSKSEALADAAVAEESPAPEVLILPVDDSPLPEMPHAETETGEIPGEGEQPPRRRRRRGRRGRGRGGEAPRAPEAKPLADRSRPGEEEVVEGRVSEGDGDEWSPDLDLDIEKEGDVDVEDEAHLEPAAGAKPGEVREMLINVAESEECRIAVLREGRLDELFVERTAASSNVGNIYKGRVTNVEPSIQAAFVDFGLPAHGFLHISDLHPQHFPDGKAETTEQVGKKTPRRQRPPIQNCLRRGQEVIVQVIKEGIGTKGPTLTSYISLPGRFLVMMPGMDQLGVSRKIEDDEQRRRMRSLLAELTLPPGIGFIVRTAGVDKHRRDLQRDLNFLVRLWRQVEKRIKTEPAPAELYKESDLVIRTIRDVYDSSLRRIVIDSPQVAQRVREFLAIASPRATDVVEVYEGDEPLFYRHGIEAEIDRLHSKTVPLPSGGSLVIEQTEAMVAIDVNSGRFRVPENAEETAFRVNEEAVDEIARQLRLRDLGGLIVCDLIDMTLDRHRRLVERRLADALRKHKERAKILRISRFGLLEMTRQRQRPSLLKSVFRDCPRCNGSGRVKSPESVALDVMRQVRLASNREGVARIDVRVATPVANDLLNRKRHQLTEVELAKEQLIQIHGVESFGLDQVELTCSDRRGRDVQGGPVEHSSASHPGGGQRFQQRGGRRRGGRGGRGRPRV